MDEFEALQQELHLVTCNAKIWAYRPKIPDHIYSDTYPTINLKEVELQCLAPLGHDGYHEFLSPDDRVYAVLEEMVHY